MDSPFFSHFRLPLPPCYPTVVTVADALPRCALRGSLDPTTGIFYRAPEHTRIRTAQACDKCRIRKAKCSGDHPVCERCRIRGLTCNYARERRTRRWSNAKAERDAVPDRSTGRLAPSSDALQPARPRSKSGSTSYGSSSRNAGADRPRSRGGNGQRTATQARPRRATIASAEVRSLSSSSPDEGAVRSERSFSQQVLDLRCLHSYPLSGSRSAVGVAHEVLETTEGSMVCGGGDGKGSLGDVNNLDLGTPRIGENALALCFDPYSDPQALIESILTPGATGNDVSCVTLADHDPTCINPGLTGAEYPEGMDGAQYPIPFYCPPHSHRSGPGPGSCFDMSSVDLGMMSNDERPLLCCASDAESPGWTPSTSSSASPALTRASLDGLPTTPTNSYPNSPLAIASLSLHLGPFASDPNAYPLFTSEVGSMDMGMHGQHHHHHGGGGMLTEYVGWREVKDGAHAFGGNVGLFVDMDTMF